MNKRLALLLLCFVVGCTPNLNTESTKTAQITSTSIPTSTPIPTLTPTITPTSTLTPTPTPAFISYESVNNIVPIERITGETLNNNKTFNKIVFSPDLKTYATFYLDDKTVIIWDAETREMISAILADISHRTTLLADMTLSPNGRMIAIGTQFGFALYDTATGEQIRTLPCRGGHAVFSSDGKIIFTGLAACDVATGQFVMEFPRKFYSDCFTFALSPDGKIAACTSDARGRTGDHKINLADISTGETIRTFDLEEVYPPGFEMFLINSLAFSPNGNILASIDSYSTVILWDVQTGSMISSFDLYSGKTGLRFYELIQTTLLYGDEAFLAFSPDNRVLAVSYGRGSIIFWDVTIANPIRIIRADIPSSGMVWADANKTIDLMKFSTDGGRLLTVSTNGESATIWGFSADPNLIIPSPTPKPLASSVILDVSGFYPPTDGPRSTYGIDFYNFSADIGTYTVELNTDNDTFLCHLFWQVLPSSNPTNGQTPLFGESNVLGSLTFNQPGEYAISIIRGGFGSECQEMSYTLKVTQP